jgi:hypothetical protein
MTIFVRKEIHVKEHLTFLFEQPAHVKNSSLHLQSERLRRAPMGRLDWLQGKINPAISRETVTNTAKPSCSRGPLESVTSTTLHSGGIQAVKTELLSTAAPYTPASKPPLTPYMPLDVADSPSVDTQTSDFDTLQDEQVAFSEDSQRTDVRRLHQVRTLLLFGVSLNDLEVRNETSLIDSKTCAPYFAASSSLGTRIAEWRLLVTVVEGAGRLVAKAAFSPLLLAPSALLILICEVSPIGRKSGMRNVVSSDAMTSPAFQNVPSSFSSDMKAIPARLSQVRCPTTTPFTKRKKRSTA